MRGRGRSIAGRTLGPRGLSGRRTFLAMLGVVLTLVGARRGTAEPVDYLRTIKPVLKQRCYACHGALKRQAGLRLDTAASIRTGGDGGPAIAPGQADESLLLDRVAETDPALRMPPEGSPLTPGQIADLRAWINQGAAAPSDEAPEPNPRAHWAFRRPVRPPVPEVKGRGWVRNPIDAFIAREREGHGLEPLPPAVPHELLRRVYLDLIGLPPGREELHAFLADPSDAAYERVVDRLLASPQYGERWARHWMDVWRYSDWYGRRAVPDVLNSYAQIWRWRDWIIRSLGEDKGYDRMVQEMLAADELAPADDANLVATGFLVRNWYRWNYDLWLKDNVEHTGKAFLALTLNCAHCHDHKYDPITQEDYFRFRAVFAPLELRHDRVPGEADPGPYPKYVYGRAYGPITSGMVRVFDEKLDAQTFLYLRGEARNVVPGRPPIPPGPPAFLAGEAATIAPVDLPVEASYPGLKPFVIAEEVGRRESALAVAERAAAGARAAWEAAAREAVAAELRRASAGIVLSRPTALFPAPLSSEAARTGLGLADLRATLRVAEADQGSARSELAAIHARIAADRVRHAKAPGDPDGVARAASRAERQAAVDRAEAASLRADRDLVLANRKGGAEAAKAAPLAASAKTALDAARAALPKESTAYTPLSPAYPTRSTGRRLALARWITDRSNPLTARVAVNHIWRWHFGTPLVATTHDFGRNGKAPTHPELLDWLALELSEPTTPGARPWSMKALHRLIVTSASYRMASHTRGPAHPGRSLDAEDRWYWRFPAARLEAEEVRDGLLQVAGALDPAIGGPDIDFARGMSSRRRSLYYTHHGEAKMPFLELFDAPDPCDCYRRTSSVVPQQALALTNNAWLLDLARTLEARLWSGASARDDDFIASAFEQVLTRPPTPDEQALSREFLRRQAALLSRGGGPGAKDTEARARRDLIHALFSHNDFVTIH